MNLDILAGLSVITIITLKHSTDDDFTITYGGPDINRKFSGWILEHGGRPLANTQATFNTGREAIDHMKRVVAECRALPHINDLQQHVRNLSVGSTLGNENPISSAQRAEAPARLLEQSEQPVGVAQQHDPAHPGPAE